MIFGFGSGFWFVVLVRGFVYVVLVRGFGSGFWFGVLVRGFGSGFWFVSSRTNYDFFINPRLKPWAI